jgi:hypothetical protein
MSEEERLRELTPEEKRFQERLIDFIAADVPQHSRLVARIVAAAYDLREARQFFERRAGTKFRRADAPEGTARAGRDGRGAHRVLPPHQPGAEGEAVSADEASGFEIWDRFAARLLADFDSQEAAMDYLREMLAAVDAGRDAKRPEDAVRTIHRMQLTCLTPDGTPNEVIAVGVELLRLMYLERGPDS